LEKITLILAHKQTEFRTSLCNLLAEQKDLEIIGQTDDGRELIKLAGLLKPDIAIMDTVLPRVNGMEATRRIKENSPETSVILLTEPGNQNFILSCLRAGAAGYFYKEDPLKQLVDAILPAHAGQDILKNKYSLNHHKHQSKEDRNGNLNLHPREIEVLKLTAKGLRNKEMAKALKISERTVQSHLSNIFNKLDVGSRTEAVLLGLNEGLLCISDLS
jgi:two-component system, NarL family, response regulator LiaR